MEFFYKLLALCYALGPQTEAVIPDHVSSYIKLIIQQHGTRSGMFCLALCISYSMPEVYYVGG